MVPRSPLLSFVTFFICTGFLHAQVVGPVQMLPLDLETPRFGEYHGPFCSGDRAYSVVPIEKSGKGRSDVGIIHHLDGSSPAVVKQLGIPFVKDHDALNAAFVFQGQPCIVHDLYDKETGEVKLHLQRYTASAFEEDGPPQLIDVLKFGPEAFALPDLMLRVTHAPDGEKVLLYFDEMGTRGFKVVRCWVLGPDFSVEWNGTYKLPIFSVGGYSVISLTNKGEVLLGLSGVEITNDLLAKEDDGTEKVRPLEANLKPANFLCYRINGETLQQWTCQLPDGRRFLSGRVCDNGHGVYFAGFIPAKEGGEEMSWALVRLDEDLQPGEVLQEGPVTEIKAAGFRQLSGTPVVNESLSRRSQLCAAADGSMVFMHAGYTMVNIAFDPDGELRWSTETRWGSSQTSPVLVAKGNTIYGGVDLSPDDIADYKAGKPMKETFDKRPVLLSWDDSGVIRFTPLIPFERPVKKGSYYMFKPSFGSLSDCGSYMDWDNERRPSLYRIAVD